MSPWIYTSLFLLVFYSLVSFAVHVVELQEVCRFRRGQKSGISYDERNREWLEARKQLGQIQRFFQSLYEPLKYFYIPRIEIKILNCAGRTWGRNIWIYNPKCSVEFNIWGVLFWQGLLVIKRKGRKTRLAETYPFWPLIRINWR